MGFFSKFRSKKQSSIDELPPDSEQDATQEGKSISKDEKYIGIIPFLVAFYQIVVAYCVCFFAIDFVFGKRIVAHSIFTDVGGLDTPIAQAFVLTVSGSIVGLIMRGLFLLQFHAVERKKFSMHYIGSYILSPWAVGLLGVASFALVQGGLIVFSPEPSADVEMELKSINLMAYLALGILSGFAWDNLMARINDSAVNIFGSKKRSVSKRQNGDQVSAQTSKSSDAILGGELSASVQNSDKEPHTEKDKN